MSAVITLLLPSPDATTAFARRLAPKLGPSDVLLLEGEIGAGKSHFARAVIADCLDRAGTPEDIPSPTFTLVQSYETRDLSIWHSDLYRLSTADEVAELGLLDAFDAALCLVEWPDRLGGEAPSSAAWLRFTPGPEDDSRWLRIAVTEGRLAEILRDAAAQFIPEAAQ